MGMPGRSYSAGNGYRYGFNGKENDNEVKGQGNQQDYGMRIYDPRLGRFLSMDPISSKYPELSSYQFASNRPIDGVDVDGLEFLKFNESLIRVQIYYDPKLRQIQALTVFRIDEHQRGTIMSRTILSGKLEDRIKARRFSPCDNCVQMPYDARVTSIVLYTVSFPDMNDVREEPSSLKPEKFKTLRVARNKIELREIEKAGKFWTEGISSNISKWKNGIALVEAVGAVVQVLGEADLKNDVDLAQGSQSNWAAQVVGLLDLNIGNGTIPGKYQNNSSLTELGNFLLFGEEIKDKDLKTVAEKIWTSYSLSIQESEKNKMEKDKNRQGVDNTYSRKPNEISN
jgi:RHS repeat-associated protein